MLKRLRDMAKKAVPRRYGLPDFGKPELPAGVELFDIRTVDALQPHAEDWDRLFAEVTPFTAFLSRSWMEAFFKHMVHAPEAWCCLFLYEAGRLTGVLPLVAGYAFVLPGVRLQLFKLPYHLMHTSGTDALLLPGGEERVMAHFFRYLGGRRGLWPFLSYKHLPENYPGARLFAGGDFAGMCAVRKPAGFESYIPVAGSGEGYTAGLAGKFRQNLRRAAAAFEGLPAAEFVFCDRARPVDELFDRFLTAEDQCWKGERGSSVKASPDSAAMMREAAAGLAAAGELAMSFLEVGGKVAAAHYAMRHGRVLYILKMG
ncbi:MAG: GNAT family N-acetyltransferase, partial [Victivallaceae bacterium]